MAGIASKKRKTEAAIQKYPSSSVASQNGIKAISIFKHDLVKSVGFPPNCWNNQLPSSRYALYEIPELKEGAKDMYEDTKNYLYEIMKKNLPQENASNLNCGTNSNPVSVKGLLNSFATSVDTRPDVFGVLKDQYPVVLIEIHSGNERESYYATIAKTAIVVIDQLCLLRNYEATLRTCTGFVFPKSSVKTYVTEVAVTFGIDLRFEVKLTALQKESIGDHIEEVIFEMYRQFADFMMKPENDMSYFIKLSPTELQMFGNGASQVASKSSIIVRCDGRFYKYIPNSHHRLIIMDLSYSPIPQVLSPSRTKKFGKIIFFDFKEMKSPLSQEEAKTCLLNLIEELYEILNNLHDQAAFAHLDLRLENVCFDANYKVMLIDLDRAAESTKNAANLPTEYPGSIMFSKPDDLKEEQWTYKHSDFRQLGNHIHTVR